MSAAKGTSLVGMAVDAAGNIAYDPSANVLSLVEAAVQRIDDLHEADRRLFSTEIAHVKEMAELREQHQRRLDAAESARIDSIRRVDVDATATTAAQAQIAIRTLAESQAAQAETLRVAVANTATTIANQFAGTVGELNKRLATLEQSSYEGRGKQAVADPQMERLAALVERLAVAQATGTGKSQGINATWAVVIAVAAVLVAIASRFFG